MADIREYICQAIDVFLKDKNTPLPFDQTKVGRVIEILNNNKYKVQIQGDTYTIKSQFHYSVNERVFVLFPCGSTTDLYIYPNKYNVITSDTEPNLAKMADGDVWIQT